MQSATLADYNSSVVAGLNAIQQQLHKGQRQHILNDGRTNDVNQSNNKQQQHAKSFSQPQTLIVDETKHYMDGLVGDDDSDDEIMKDEKGLDLQQQHQQGEIGSKKPGKKTRGRVKIKMEFIQNKLRRYTTFSKRKTGIMKKAYELSTLTGTQVMLLVASETGHVYTFATRKLQPMITSESGKALIQTCLNSPDPTPTQQVIPQATIQQAQIAAINNAPMIQQHVPPTQINLNNGPSDQRMSQTGYQEPDLQYANSEEELKGVQSSAQQNLSNATTYPVTYITNSGGQGLQTTKQIPVAVQSGGITTIFSPSSTTSVINTTQQPQILSGQLQLHRIHPQNIILTGNSPSLQSTNHIILNPSSGQSSSIMMSTDNTQVVYSNRQQQHQDNVLLVQNSELSSSVPSLQMVYSANGGGVIYAPQTGIKRQTIDNNGVSMQHTPVIQTSLNQDEQRVVEGENGTIIVRHSQASMK